jgi:excisionase family DNA binding protein
MEERLYTIEEAADKLAVGEECVRAWLYSGNITGIRVNDEWRIRHSDMEHFITSHSRTTEEETQGEYRPGF